MNVLLASLTPIITGLIAMVLILIGIKDLGLIYFIGAMGGLFAGRIIG